MISTALALSASSCEKAQGGISDDQKNATATPVAEAAAEIEAPRAPLSAEEKQFYRDVARHAWTYMDVNFDPGTGFVKATPEWPNTTLWDIGGQLLAYHAGKELGFIKPEEFDRRMKKTLATLERVELFQNAAYNKLYSTKDGSLTKEGRPGWSATDLGRFMVALKILGVREPQFAAQTERIARRIDFSQTTKDGYLFGRMMGESGKPWNYQEGRIGYEQYVAEGFNFYGAPVANALNVKKNARTIKVMGVEIMQDKRWTDRLLSEPFILQGVELGMKGDYAKLARNVLRLQEERYKKTGQITIASEDAVAIAPHYFFYYCVYCDGKPFVIDISSPGKPLDSPRWVSTKGAFGWNAILPSEYTKKAQDLVLVTRDPKHGWASGVFEKTGVSTQTFDVNTAAIMIEIAFFQLRGAKPLIEASPIS